MNIDFGRITKYIFRKGYGFVDHNLQNLPQKQLFFHIKTIKQADKALAKLLSNANQKEDLFFWYSFEKKKKGYQVCAVYSPKSLIVQDGPTTESLKKQLQTHWKALTSDPPIWLEKATSYLLGEEALLEFKKQKQKSVFVRSFVRAALLR